MSHKTSVAWITPVHLLLRSSTTNVWEMLSNSVYLRTPHKRLREQLSKLNAVF